MNFGPDLHESQSYIMEYFPLQIDLIARGPFKNVV